MAAEFFPGKPTKLGVGLPMGVTPAVPPGALIESSDSPAAAPAVVSQEEADVVERAMAGRLPQAADQTVTAVVSPAPIQVETVDETHQSEPGASDQTDDGGSGGQIGLASPPNRSAESAPSDEGSPTTAVTPRSEERRTEDKSPPRRKLKRRAK